MENEKVVVCRARIEDLEGIIKLLHQLSPPKPGENTDKKNAQEVLEGILNNPDYCLCVAYLGSEPVGTALLLIQRNLSHGVKPYAHVENVVTDIRFRGKGIGQKMVDYLVSQARENDCYKVILCCETKNIPFYEHCGFSLTGESEMRIALK